jgi:hypothetical protein
MKVFRVEREGVYFLRGDWTTQITLIGKRKFRPASIGFFPTRATRRSIASRRRPAIHVLAGTPRFRGCPRQPGHDDLLRSEAELLGFLPRRNATDLCMLLIVFGYIR